MAMNRIQFQPGLSLAEFFERYGTEAQCAAALEQARWPDGFRCPRYPTAWLIHHKVMQAMAEREASYLLDGQIQVDDAYLGGERRGGKAGRGSENKLPFVAAVSLNTDGHPLYAKLTPVAGFRLEAITEWAKTALRPGSTVYSDGLACFRAVATAGCTHQPTVIAGRKPQDVPEFHWINTVLGNLKTSLSGTYHAIGFQKYAARYLAAFTYRFNRRFDLRALPTRLLMAAVRCQPQPQRVIRSAELHC